jgi:protein-tyrosine phosphatase
MLRESWKSKRLAKSSQPDRISHDLIPQHNIKQMVKHYQFMSWPDQGIPSKPAALLAFCRKIRSDMQETKQSLIVHSSAGAGRTGTFIAVDMMLQMIASQSEVPIARLVERLRKQRVEMVETVEQYNFLYEIERLARNQSNP